MVLGLTRFNPFSYVDSRIEQWIYRDIFYFFLFLFTAFLIAFIPEFYGKTIAYYLCWLLIVVYYVKVILDADKILTTPELRDNVDEPMLIVGISWFLLFGFLILIIAMAIVYVTGNEKYKKWKKERQELFEKQVRDLYDWLDTDKITRSVELIDEMGQLRNHLAIEPLTILLEYPDESVKTHAAQALAAINRKGSAKKSVKPA